MAADLSTVLLALPGLNPDDLLKVVGKTKALLSLSGAKPGATTAPPRVVTPTQDYLLEGIHHELRRRGLIGRQARLPERSFPTSYVSASYAVRQNLESHLPSLRSPERTALGQLAARSLAGWLEMSHVQVRPKSMLTNVSNVTVALDWSFPDYLECGQLASCWRG